MSGIETLRRIFETVPPKEENLYNALSLVIKRVSADSKYEEKFACLFASLRKAFERSYNEQIPPGQELDMCQAVYKITNEIVSKSKDMTPKALTALRHFDAIAPIYWSILHNIDVIATNQK
jgi:hypothetical protein